jgi:hypothetical protein
MRINSVKQLESVIFATHPEYTESVKDFIRQKVEMGLNSGYEVELSIKHNTF